MKHVAYQIVAELIGRCLASKSLFIVGIDGCGGAGKSRLAENLRGAITGHGREVAAVHMDDFFLPSALRAVAPSFVVGRSIGPDFVTKSWCPCGQVSRRALNGTTGAAMCPPSGTILARASLLSKASIRRVANSRSFIISRFGSIARESCGSPEGLPEMAKALARSGRRSGCLLKIATSASNHRIREQTLSMQRP